MAERQKKRCSTSLIVTETQIEMTIRNHLVPVSEWLVSKRPEISVSEAEKRDPHALLVGVQAGAAAVENGMEGPQKATNRATLKDPVLPLLHMCPKTMKSVPQRDLHAYVRCSIIHTGQIRKRPKRPVMEEWMRVQCVSMTYVIQPSKRKFCYLQPHG